MPVFAVTVPLWPTEIYLLAISFYLKKSVPETENGPFDPYNNAFCRIFCGALDLLT